MRLRGWAPHPPEVLLPSRVRVANTEEIHHGLPKLSRVDIGLDAPWRQLP